VSGPLASIRGQRYDAWMARALAVAVGAGNIGSDMTDRKPAGDDDVPVGAVVYGPDGAELATGCNERERTGDPTGHAEIVALRAAAGALGTWRLDGCTLVVTLEPCTMCAGAAVLARIATVVFGAWEPKTGAVGSLFDVVRDRRLTHRPEVYAGVREAECAALLRDFFTDRR
jgi:tRNA(adenine34) deaminase